METTGIGAVLVDAGDDFATRLDVNDEVVYSLDAKTDLGSAAARGTLLEAGGVEGGTPAGRVRANRQMLFVVNLLPAETIDDLLDAYEALVAEFDRDWNTLAWEFPGSSKGPFYIDFFMSDQTPNLVRGQADWIVGCKAPPGDPVAIAVPVMRTPRSYSAGAYL